MSYVDSVLSELIRKNPAQDEFIQAATEVLNSLRPVIEANPQFEKAGLLERLTEPERVVTVSYTHLDVYKRQGLLHAGAAAQLRPAAGGTGWSESGGHRPGQYPAGAR